jgi:hypothetical protein
METKHLDQLETEGYTVLPGFLTRDLTAALREHIDCLAPPVAPPDLPGAKRIHDIRHPIPGALMARLITPELLAVAQAVLRVPEIARLRLLEQVLIRTDPKPPPHGPVGWHVDWAFSPAEFAATPRQTYFHMVHAANTVEPGGAAFLIVPGSHHQTYAVTARLQTEEELEAFRRQPVEMAGVRLAEAVEVCVQEGDLIIFNPMAIHSASGNARATPRYVYFASFFDVSAQRLHDRLKAIQYQKGFSDDLRAGLPMTLRTLLDW